jgi:hypothetical protein
MLCIYKSDAQRTRSRSRTRGNRNRGDQLCHLKEVDSCLDKIQALTKGPNPTAIITTSEGLDKICGYLTNLSFIIINITSFSIVFYSEYRTVNEVVKCIKSFIRKCGTPLQRELFDFGTEYFVQTIKQFCDVGTLRESKFQSIINYLFFGTFYQL